jgi:hypothetical protein
MAVCPRCNANLPDGTERCLVCGYGLPGTAAEMDDPKAPEPTSKSTAPAGEVHTEPGGVPSAATTQQVYSGDRDATLGAVGATLAAGAASDRTSVMQVPGTEGTEAAPQPRRRFPLNTVLIVVVAAVAIGLLALGLTTGSGSGSGGHTSKPATSTTKPHHNVASTTTTAPRTTTTAAPPPLATTTTTATTLPPTTTTTAPKTTTTVPRTTTTTAPTTTTTTTPPTTTTTAATTTTT